MTKETSTGDTARFKRCISALHEKQRKNQDSGLVGTIRRINNHRKELHLYYEGAACNDWYHGDLLKNLYHSFMEVITR